MLKKVEPVIVQFKDTVQHIHITRGKPARRIILFLPSVIIFCPYAQHIIEYIIQKRILIIIMGIKSNLLTSAFLHSSVIVICSKSPCESILTMAAFKLRFVLIMRLSSISLHFPLLV